MPDMTPAEIEQKAREIEAKNKAQFVVDKYKERQRALARLTLEKYTHVHDIIELVDTQGTDVIIWVFREPKFRDIAEGSKAVVMMVFLEQNHQGIVFEEVLFQGGRYWTSSPRENLALKVKNCEVPY